MEKKSFDKLQYDTKQIVYTPFNEHQHPAVVNEATTDVVVVVVVFVVVIIVM